MQDRAKQDKFMELFEPLNDGLWRFCLVKTRNKDIAKDIMSETIYLAFKNFEKLKNEKAFLSFLFTIASRVYNHEKKRNSRFNLTEPYEFELYSSNSSSPEDLVDIKILYEALDKMNEKVRESIILFEIFGLSRAEISKIHSTTIANVKIRLYRGRKQLAKLLKENNNFQMNDGERNFNKPSEFIPKASIR